ncbi:hypothetical protein BM221_005461 [Beauveria bassiana]|uniref:Uncharacterized protein n=1 Tax=Beauveria bassiana TaxID=176275 RepID=A0A2N6NNM9_BEABA|nr:hypothetical protein BM221_005461 [Beauveria bassiana]
MSAALGDSSQACQRRTSKELGRPRRRNLAISQNHDDDDTGRVSTDEDFVLRKCRSAGTHRCGE